MCGNQHEDQQISMRVNVVTLRLVVILRSTEEPVQCPVSIFPVSHNAYNNEDDNDDDDVVVSVEVVIVAVVVVLPLLRD